MNRAKEFFDIVNLRNAVIDEAKPLPIDQTDKVRELSKSLHPEVQHLFVSEIREYKDARSYKLVPDVRKGTVRIAPFTAGQYLSVNLVIGDAVTTRPYSISSGPIESVQENAYTLTIKRVKDGFASNYILDTWQVGTLVDVSGPQGTFAYEPVRDAKHVIGIAGGSGITPFRSMASAIADGYEDFNLTILYGSRTPEDILFKDDFDEFAKRTDKVKVVHVLSDVEEEGYEHGFIHAGLIAKYLPEKPPFSFFICGPKGLYDFIGGQLENFHMPAKYIRYELFGAGEAPETAKGKVYELTVDIRGTKQTIPARADETVLVAIERAGMKAPSRCRSGECGYCHSRLVSGQVYIPEQTDGRRLADVKFGFIHPCCSYPLSDLEIETTEK